MPILPSHARGTGFFGAAISSLPLLVLQFRRRRFYCGPFRRRTILLPNNFGASATRFSIKLSLFFIYIILLLFCLKKILVLYFYFIFVSMYYIHLISFDAANHVSHSPIKFSLYIYNIID